MINVDLLYYKYYKKTSVKAIPASTIPFYDFTVVFDGELVYEINGEKIVLSGGDCILIPPQNKRKRKEGNVLSEYVSFNFMCKEKPDLPLTVKNCIDNKLRYIVFACNEIKDPYEEENKIIIERLTEAALVAVSLSVSNGKYNDITLSVISYVRKNYAQKLSLLTISAHVGYSPTYCDGVFKKDFGKPIINYLVDFRIQKAKEMLIENILSLQTVAENAGFSDYNYFSRMFKKRVGISPARFRQKFNS